MTQEEEKQPAFNEIIDALLDDDADFPFPYLQLLSDLLPDQLEQLQKVWLQITPQRKIKLFENIEILAEDNFRFDFEPIAKIGLNDNNSAIRASAIRILAQFEPEEEFAKKFIDMMNNDTEIDVRAEAANALGKFVYLGEIEEIDESTWHEVEDALLDVINSDEPTIIHQKALLGLSFSSREEVPGLITNAYQSTDNTWIVTAVISMGRSADEVWADKVLTSLANPNLHIQKAAVTAAGKLGLKPARNLLLRMVNNPSTEEDLWVECIWSLSEIGGDNIEAVFQRLLEKEEDGEIQAFLEEAIENLGLTNGLVSQLDMFGFGEASIEELKEFDVYDSIEDDMVDSWIDDLKSTLEDQLEEDDEEEEE